MNSSSLSSNARSSSTSSDKSTSSAAIASDKGYSSGVFGENSLEVLSDASISLIFALAVAILKISCLDVEQFSELLDGVVLFTEETDVRRCKVK